MENNNSKQAILSIVGIAILVIAVVGVSFAFFTYSRTGTNNTITTGSITFSLDPGSENPTIDAKDTFPGEEPDPDDPGANFDVKGTLPEGANPVKYYVYAIAGDNLEEKTRLKSSQVSMKLTATGTGSESVIYENNYNTGAAAGELFSDPDTKLSPLANGFKMASGTLAAGSSIEVKFNLKMWINDTVTVSDTDYSASYRASATSKGDQPEKNGAEQHDAHKLPSDKETDDREVYSDKYFSVKIKVVASDDPKFNGN